MFIKKKTSVMLLSPKIAKRDDNGQRGWVVIKKCLRSVTKSLGPIQKKV